MPLKFESDMNSAVRN